MTARAEACNSICISSHQRRRSAAAALIHSSARSPDESDRCSSWLLLSTRPLALSLSPSSPSEDDCTTTESERVREKICRRDCEAATAAVVPASLSWSFHLSLPRPTPLSSRLILDSYQSSNSSSRRTRDPLLPLPLLPDFAFKRHHHHHPPSSSSLRLTSA